MGAQCRSSEQKRATLPLVGGRERVRAKEEKFAGKYFLAEGHPRPYLISIPPWNIHVTVC